MNRLLKIMGDAVTSTAADNCGSCLTSSTGTWSGVAGLFAVLTGQFIQKAAKTTLEEPWWAQIENQPSYICY